MGEPGGSSIDRAAGLLPSVACVLTAGWDGRRAGIMTPWVMRCGREPACMCVALPCGRAISPLIRDSRGFGLCLLSPGDQVTARRFEAPAAEDADPFAGIPVVTLATGSPLLAQAAAAIDCEVIRHFGFESDHEMYVGRIVAARVSD